MEDRSFENVKRIRKAKNVSLKTLSEQSGLSASFLCNYENGKVNITLKSLHQIAKALDVSVKLLLDTEEDPFILVIPKNKRFSVKGVNKQGEDSFVQDFLTRGANFDMQVTVVRLDPHQDNGAPDTHDGQEFIYVIHGTATLLYNFTREITLNEGDFAYYDAHTIHGWYNPGETEAEFLAVASRRGF